jgi:hypothetical protein
VDAAVNFLKQCYSAVVPVLSSIILAESPRIILTVDNRHVLNCISEGVPIPPEVIKLSESVNQTPQLCRALYDQVLEKAILGTILDPLTIDPQLIDEHVILETFDKVKSLIRATRDMDILPYQIAKRHRDHYYHQINVGGLGARLLDVQSMNGMPLWKYMAQNLKLKGNDEVKERKAKAIWWIAALLHDHAYALAHAITFLPDLIALKHHAAHPTYVKKTFDAHQELLEQMMAHDMKTDVFQPLYDNNAPKAYKGLETLVRKWLAHELAPIGVEETVIYQAMDNHGVMGAVNLLSHISAENFEGEWQGAFEAIAAAILVHHLPEKPKIWFDKRPLSFILTFIDEIQEWSRLHVCGGKHKTCLERIELGSFLGPSEQPGTLYFKDYLEIVFPFVNEDMLKEIEWDRERFHKDKANGLNRLVLPDPALKSGFPSKIKWREAYISMGRPG